MWKPGQCVTIVRMPFRVKRATTWSERRRSTVQRFNPMVFKNLPVSCFLDPIVSGRSYKSE